MPVPRSVAKFNRVVTNPILGRIAPWLPGLGVIHHRGRRSGRDFRTPVNVFRRGDRYLIALTYGSRADWVKNILAAGQCDLHTRGQRHHLVNPILYVDAARGDMTPLVRGLLTMTGISEFLALTRSTAAR